MIKKLLVFSIVVLSFNSYAQQGTTSPYSFYGIGSLKFKGTIENRSMGGLSIFADSIHINLRNPATYAGEHLKLLPFNNESRPVKFAVGGTHNETNLKTQNQSDKASASTFDYIAVSIPLNKFGVGFGLLPYTAVGYKLENINETNDITNRFSGQGGVNKVFFSLGYLVTKELSIGVDMNYNFGNIQNSAIEFLYDDEGNIIQYQSRENNRSDLSGLNWNFGVHYKKQFKNNLELQSGITYSPQSDLNSINQRSFSTVVINAQTGAEAAVNTIDADLVSLGLEETNLTLPSRLAFGVGVGKPRHWFIGAEYTTLQTSKFSNQLYNNSLGTNFEDASTIAVGGFFIPKYNSFSSYWKRVVYRAGVRFENTGLNINNQTINEFGMSFGVGLPVGNVFSNANLGFEIGKRGTTNNNLVQENFVNFQLSLSLNDRWFQKRKYD